MTQIFPAKNKAAFCFKIWAVHMQIIYANRKKKQASVCDRIFYCILFNFNILFKGLKIVRTKVLKRWLWPGHMKLPIQETLCQ